MSVSAHGHPVCLQHCSNMGRWQGGLETQGFWWLICSLWWHNNSIERGERATNWIEEKSLYLEIILNTARYQDRTHRWDLCGLRVIMATTVWHQQEHRHTLHVVVENIYIFCQNLLLDIRYYLHSFCIQSATTYDSKKQVEAFTLISSISISQHIPESFIFVILFLKLRLPILSSITLINQRLDTNYFSG